MKIKITKHANDRRLLYGITKEQLKRAIIRGAITKQTDGYLAHYTYIKVAYKKMSKGLYKIKTVFMS